MGATEQEMAREMRSIKNRTTWIQGMGAHFGKPAGELQIGDVMVWNGGSTSTVAEIVNTTEKKIEIAEECQGTRYTRKFLKSRIVAIAGMGVAGMTKAEFSSIPISRA